MHTSRKRKILITAAAGISVGIISCLLWIRHKNAAAKKTKEEKYEEELRLITAAAEKDPWGNLATAQANDSQPRIGEEPEVLPQLPAGCDFISSTELQNLLKTQSDSDYVLFDVRSKLIDYAGGNIISNINISDKGFYDYIPDIIKNYNNKSQLIIYCMYGARRSIKCIEFYSKAICDIIENYSPETKLSYYFMYHLKFPSKAQENDGSESDMKDDNKNADNKYGWIDETVAKRRVNIDFCDDTLIENLSKQKMMILKGGYFEFLNGLLGDSLENIKTGNIIKDFDESMYEKLEFKGLASKPMWYHKTEYFAN